jgi:hypothetical protein
MIFFRVMKNNNTFAIVAIAALLIATATMTNPSLINQAFATKRFHETASQSCVNQNARCQDLLSQIQGHDNAATLIGNQPTAASVAPVPAVSDCVKCFDPLSDDQVKALGTALGISATSRTEILTAICEGLENGSIAFSDIVTALAQDVPGLNGIGDIVSCLTKFKP